MDALVRAGLRAAWASAGVSTEGGMPARSSHVPELQGWLRIADARHAALAPLFYANACVISPHS